MNNTTQNQQVMAHLKRHGSITAAEAYEAYGVMRLAARIADLKEMGYDIHTEIITGNNRYGHGVRYAKYTWQYEPEARDVRERSLEE